MKKISLLILISLLIFLTGCSSNTISQSDIVNDDNTFVIGIDANYPPFGYTDDEGNLIGFDLALAQQTADKLGQELVIVPIEWAQKDEILESGQIDAIWSGLTITEERAETYDFTDPYLTVAPVVVVKENSTIGSIEDLRDMVVGVQEGSVAYDILHKLPIYEEIDHETLFEENVNALKNLDVGLTDALIVDSAVADWYITDQKADYKIVDSFDDIYLGVAFSKDNTELRDQVNEILEELKSNGTAEELSNEWFGSNLIYNS